MDATVQDDGGHTPLHLAAQATKTGSGSIVHFTSILGKFLLSSWNITFSAKMWDQFPWFELLLERVWDIHKRSSKRITWIGDVCIVFFLVIHQTKWWNGMVGPDSRSVKNGTDVMSETFNLRYITISCHVYRCLQYEWPTEAIRKHTAKHFHLSTVQLQGMKAFTGHRCVAASDDEKVSQTFFPKRYRPYSSLEHVLLDRWTSIMWVLEIWIGDLFHWLFWLVVLFLFSDPSLSLLKCSMFIMFVHGTFTYNCLKKRAEPFMEQM